MSLFKPIEDLVKNRQYEDELREKGMQITGFHDEKKMFPIHKNPDKFHEYYRFKEASEEERTRIREEHERETKMKTLEQGLADVAKRQQLTIYHHSTRGRITLWMSDTKKVVTFRGGPYEYISKIIKNGNVSINDLKSGGSRANSNISGTIRDLNLRFRKKLRLSEDLILNLKDGSGYFFNPKLHLQPKEMVIGK